MIATPQTGWTAVKYSSGIDFYREDGRYVWSLREVIADDKVQRIVDILNEVP